MLKICHMTPDDFSPLIEDVLPHRVDRTHVTTRNSALHRLMLGVLSEAVGLYLRAHDPRRHMLPSRRREILIWFASSDMTWPFSFERICETLDFDADYLRKGLARKAGVLAARPPQKDQQVAFAESTPTRRSA